MSERERERERERESDENLNAENYFFPQLKLIHSIELETKDVFSKFYPLNIVNQLSHKIVILDQLAATGI